MRGQQAGGEHVASAQLVLVLVHLLIPWRKEKQNIRLLDIGNWIKNNT